VITQQPPRPRLGWQSPRFLLWLPPDRQEQAVPEPRDVDDPGVRMDWIAALPTGADRWRPPPGSWCTEALPGAGLRWRGQDEILAGSSASGCARRLARAAGLTGSGHRSAWFVNRRTMPRS